jgi:hypothetical protein
MFTRQPLAILIFSLSMCLSPLSFAQDHAIPAVQDITLPLNTTIEFDEDRDEIIRAVEQGLIKPFSALYQTVNQDLYGRIIKVELEEDDDEWTYELKLIYENQIIKVEYNASSLQMLELKGRHLQKVIK